MGAAAINLDATEDRLLSWIKSVSVRDLSDAIGADQRTVRSWREQQSQPTLRHVKAMARLWGKDFILDIFAPSFPTDEDALREIQIARHALNSLERRLEADIHDHAQAIARDHVRTDRQPVRGLGRAVSALGKSTAIVCLACLVTLASLHTEKRPDARTYRGPVRREEVSL